MNRPTPNDDTRASIDNVSQQIGPANHAFAKQFLRIRINRGGPLLSVTPAPDARGLRRMRRRWTRARQSAAS